MNAKKEIRDVEKILSLYQDEDRTPEEKIERAKKRAEKWTDMEKRHLEYENSLLRQDNLELSRQLDKALHIILRLDRAVKEAEGWDRMVDSRSRCDWAANQKEMTENRLF